MPRLPDLRTPAGPLRFPDGSGVHESVASGEIYRVASPRCTSAWSCSAQLLTRYSWKQRFQILYLGWTLDFMRGSWPIEPSGSEGPPIRAILLDHSCTNADQREIERLWPIIAMDEA